MIFIVVKYLRTSKDEAGVHLAFIGVDQTVSIISGGRNVHDFIYELLKERSSLVISDDYNHWSRSDESDDSGKLVLVRLENNDDMHVFFDDNIERDRAHIVDVREYDTFAPIPFSMSRQRYLRRVEPFQVITDPQYFIKKVGSIIDSNI